LEYLSTSAFTVRTRVAEWFIDAHGGAPVDLGGKEKSMPRRTHRSRILGPLAAASLGLACFGLNVSPAHAGPRCPDFGPTTQAFAGFGDLDWYYLAPNGGFESELAWSQSGPVQVISYTDPFDLLGADDHRSLLLSRGGRVTTPQLCVSRRTPHMRFLGMGYGSDLEVTVRTYGDDGEVTDSSTDAVWSDDRLTWRPSPKVDLKTSEFELGRIGYVDLTFETRGYWVIDDVLIDPYRKG
jgi:hypothetical protein